MAIAKKRNGNGRSTSRFGKETSAAIGARLRELREGRGLTAREVGEAIEISPASILAYERGARRITADAIKLIADFYGVRPAEIWRGI